MQWTLVLVAETEPGQRVEQSLCTVEGITHRVGWLFAPARFEDEGEFFRCTLQDVQYR